MPSKLELYGSSAHWYYWRDKDTGLFYRTKIDSMDDVARGRCSGFLKCCIEFYITVWMQDLESKDNKEHAEAMKQARKEGYVFYYIPCPKCLASKNFVTSKSCTKDNCFCGQWERKIQIREAWVERKKAMKQSRASRKQRRGYA